MTLKRLGSFIRGNSLRIFLLYREESEESRMEGALVPKPFVSSRQGQVAIVLLLIIAFALIFYAVSLNFSRLSQMKMMTTVAANAGAGQLASQMASYGQMLYATYMDGKTHEEGWTGFLGHIIGFVVSLGASLIESIIKKNPMIFIKTLAYGIEDIRLQMEIEAMLTDWWNGLFDDTMATQDDFVERGVSLGLQRAVTDTKMVPDMHDYDMDRLWGYTGGEPNDYLSRFVIYYNKRLESIKTYDTARIGDFLAGLQDFVYARPGGDWGLFDNSTTPACEYVPFGNHDLPSECNPCCVPDRAEGLYGDIYNPRPECCDHADPYERCGELTNCFERDWGPFTELNPVNNSTYNYVYDRFYENSNNNMGVSSTFSFREHLGRDDEHQLYLREANHIPQDPHPSGEEGYYLEEATGYVNWVLGFDSRSGIFPIFYKLADWGVHLEGLDFTKYPEHCFWVDNSRGVFSPDCDGVTLPYELNEIHGDYFPLPHDPSGGEIQYELTSRVDSTTDKVALPRDIAGAPLSRIIADEVVDCAEFSFYGMDEHFNDTGKGFWKRGASQYCTDGDIELPGGWPYHLRCHHHGTCLEDGPEGQFKRDCRCGEITPPEVVETQPDPAAEWPEDVLDDIVYGIPNFVEIAQWLLSADLIELAQSIAYDWYEELAPWIEAGPDSWHIGARECFICSDREGTLWLWYKEIVEMQKRINDWLAYSFAGADCAEAWCVPPEKDPLRDQPNEYGLYECSGVSPAEQAAFDSDGISGRGSFRDIRACLEWNAADSVYAEGADPIADPPIGAGNADKFRLCREHCNEYYCHPLPRSVIPLDSTGYNPADFTMPTYQPAKHQEDVDAFLLCLDQCSEVNCQAMPLTQSWDPTTDYAWQKSPLSFTASDCNGPTPVGTWHEDIIKFLAEANPSCDLDPSGLGNGWLLNTQQSAIEAENQVAKFKVRRDFLDKRLADLESFLALLHEAEEEFYKFLTCEDLTGPAGVPDGEPDGAACRLIKYRRELSDEPMGLPYHAIYAWQSDPPPGRDQGYWHVVRADARIPGRCDNACGIDPHTGAVDLEDPRWPDIETDTKEFLGMDYKRTYDLLTTPGMVKMRVARFDEDKDAGILRFPGKQKIWDFRGRHPGGPDRGYKDFENLGEQIWITCQDLMVDGPAGHEDIYNGAFIINSHESPTDAKECWNFMNSLLSNGVVSESCAQYYFHEGRTKGFGLNFVPCGNI